jgi:tRNA (cmo5U34)-methyltransferase
MRDREAYKDFTFGHRKEGFDNHIEASIRHYTTLHQDVVNLSKYFVENDTRVVDIGCSTGKTVECMIHTNKETAPNAQYCGVEYAPVFQEEMTDRAKRLNKEGHHVSFLNKDIIHHGFDNCSLVTSIFTLQFMQPIWRERVLQNIYDGLNKGSAFIFAEKTLASDSRIQDMMTSTYLEYKSQHFSYEDIMEKEKTLRTMLKPMTWNDIVELLEKVGFDRNKIQPFFQQHLFVGAVAIK